MRPSSRTLYRGMLSSNMSVVNDYIMFRLLMEDSERKSQRKYSLQQHMQPRGSIFAPRGSIGEFEPFCSPVVPHVPIRERLARRGTSADVNDDLPNGYAYSMAGGSGYPRRRRMSLLQTLRQQNKALADSGLEIRQRTDSENTSSPPQKSSPPLSPSKKGLSSLKTKLFGKKDKKHQQSIATANGECSQSCDLIQGKSRKSPSTTNDSGHGSQGHLEDKFEAMVIMENDDEVPVRMARLHRRIRTSSCPDLSQMCTLTSSRRAPLVDSESDEDRHYQQVTDRMERNSSPITAADLLLERRILRRQMEAEQRQKCAHAM